MVEASRMTVPPPFRRTTPSVLIFPGSHCSQPSSGMNPSRLQFSPAGQILDEVLHVITTDGHRDFVYKPAWSEMECQHSPLV